MIRGEDVWLVEDVLLPSDHERDRMLADAGQPAHQDAIDLQHQPAFRAGFDLPDGQLFVAHDDPAGGPVHGDDPPVG